MLATIILFVLALCSGAVSDDSNLKCYTCGHFVGVAFYKGLMQQYLHETCAAGQTPAVRFLQPCGSGHENSKWTCGTLVIQRIFGTRPLKGFIRTCFPVGTVEDGKCSEKTILNIHNQQDLPEFVKSFLMQIEPKIGSLYGSYVKICASKNYRTNFNNGYILMATINVVVLSLAVTISMGACQVGF